MKKHYLSVLILVLSGFYLFAQEAASPKYVFDTIHSIETTPVKNQGASGTCWNYSATSFMETEVLRQTGRVLDLAEMFTVFNTYMEKADRYVRMHGNLNFGQGGNLHDVPMMYAKYGAVPQSVYEGLNYGTEINRHGELDAVLKAMLDAVIENKNKKLTPVWKEAYKKVLEVYLGFFPENFEFEGKTYTPKSFAEEVVRLDFNDYYQFTSWTHQPFFKPMHIMIPDNWLYGISYNLPMENLTEIVDHALAKGFSVAWASDWSEKGISWKEGIVYVPEKPWEEMSAEERENMFSGPAPEMEITQEIRQEAYDNYTTTDDHGLHIVGLARDQSGKEYYIVKNSWDTGNVYEGYLYVTKSFFNFKTISIMVHKDGVPGEVLSKI
jgi:bleomycin hydrolase